VNGSTVPIFNVNEQPAARVAPAGDAVAATPANAVTTSAAVARLTLIELIIPTPFSGLRLAARAAGQSKFNPDRSAARLQGICSR
jgi:hypothetical protein